MRMYVHWATVPQLTDSGMTCVSYLSRGRCGNHNTMAY